MKQIVFLIACCIALNSCKEENVSQKPDKLHWILGEWTTAEKEGIFIEVWKKKNDTLFTGKGFFITPANDTPFREMLSIENRNDTLYYVVTTAHNGDMPVTFKEISMSDKEIVFEDREHDFPQQIIYTRLNDKNIVAKITGKQNGKTRTEEFMLKKED